MTVAGADLPKTMHVAKAARPLRIAVVYSRLPFPMMRGDQLTVAHLLSFLAARGHAVDLYTLDCHGALSVEQGAWLNTACKDVRIYPHSQLRLLAGAWWALLTGLPFQVGLFHNAALAADLAERAAGGAYDVIYGYYARSAPDIPSAEALGQGRPATFLALQLSQALNTERLHAHERAPLKRLFYRIEAARFRRYEARVWRRFDRTLLIGPADVEAVKAVCRQEGQPEIDNWRYAAHGVDADRYAAAQPGEIVPGRVVMSGAMAYRPNVQAALWFVRECWPAVRAAEPAAELMLQGRDPAPEIRALHGRDGVMVTGTVAEVGVHIRSAAVCIDPMLAAGGMQNKLIEYMACGKAVVATSVANEGVRAPAETLVIGDTAEAFARAVIALLRDPSRAAVIGARARAHVLAHWTWEKHFLDLESEFLAALDGERAHAA